MIERLILAAATCLLLAGGARAQTAPSDAECRALAGLAITDTNLLSATLVPAREDGLPAHCRVLGYVRPAINFELRLPISGWNGKFYMVGCGGFCGQVLSERPHFTNAMNHGLRRGYAAATTDAGHWGSSAVDARFAWNNRLAEIDWGTRAIPEVTRASRALVAVYYGRRAERSYFAGCSTGGRQGLMEAQRFPDDFDGIIAGSPALDETQLAGTFLAWTGRANMDAEGRRILDPAKVPLISRAVSQACDPADGLRDGLVSDPRACRFDPAVLQCQAGADPAQCLSPAEVGVLRAWYQGPRDSAGRQLYPGGIPLGSEPYWPVWLAGTVQNPPLNPLFARDYLRYMGFREDPGDSYELQQFDFDRDPARLAQMSSFYDATSTDLSRFRARNGRLLIYHGWADAIVTPERTVQWFEAATEAAGGREAMAQHARLFMIPGFDHCGLGGAGPGITETGFDPLTALEAWVERGEAPASLLMTRSAEPRFSRPACPWPQVARHMGGDPATAESFRCADP